jgi:hypothetical protein
MVSRGIGDNATLFLLVAQLRYGIEGATKLEGANPLEILAF